MYIQKKCTSLINTLFPDIYNNNTWRQSKCPSTEEWTKMWILSHKERMK